MTFWRVCLLRESPQRLPASGFLLSLSLAAYFLVAVLLATVTLPLSTALAAAGVDTVLLVALLLAALQLRGVPARLNQALTAAAGSLAILGAISLPATQWLDVLMAQGADVTLPLTLILLLQGWSIVITAHVLRHALDLPFLAGLGIAIVYFIVALQILNALFLPTA